MHAIEFTGASADNEAGIGAGDSRVTLGVSSARDALHRRGTWSDRLLKP